MSRLIEKKRLEGQLEVARQVQLELLPPAILNSKVLTSAPTTFRQKRSRATTTIGFAFTTIRLES